MQNLKIKTKNIILLSIVFSFAFLLFSFNAAEAATFTATGNPDDTASGEVITAYATNESLFYRDINNNGKPTVYPDTDIEITVLPVYGFSSASLPSAVSVYKGIKAYQSNAVTNEGNASDSITLTFTCDFSGAGSGTWTVNIKRASDDSLIGALTSGDPSTTEVITLAEDSDYLYYHEVGSPADGIGGDSVKITTERETTSTPTGEYTGGNGLTYAGIGFKSDETTYTLDQPNLTLTRTTTVDAPTATGGNYSGGDHDVVPGSVITSKITYSNLGNVSAESVIITLYLPHEHTDFAHLNKDIGATDRVNITMGQGNATGWTVWYSTLAGPQEYYGDPTGWSMLGTIESTSDVFPAGSDFYNYIDHGAAEFAATWIKWEKQYVDPAEDNKTLTWGVTVR